MCNWIWACLASFCIAPDPGVVRGRFVCYTSHDGAIWVGGPRKNVGTKAYWTTPRTRYITYGRLSGKPSLVSRASFVDRAGRHGGTPLIEVKVGPSNEAIEVTLLDTVR